MGKISGGNPHPLIREWRGRLDELIGHKNSQRRKINGGG